jgi:hypothetical protein
VAAILFIEQAGVIRDRTVRSCREHAPEVVSVSTVHAKTAARRIGSARRPRGDEAWWSMAARPGRGEHPADARGKRDAEHAQAGPDEGLEGRRSLRP